MSPLGNGSPRIGVPYRTTKEEANPASTELKNYSQAVRLAGGLPVPVSLQLSTSELKELAGSLDGIALSGSPADVDPYLYRERRDARSAAPDRNRERTDFGLIEYCLRDRKPILAICYGIQSLNVELGGTLIHDIPSEALSHVEHDHEDNEPDATHEIILEPNSRLAAIAVALKVMVNSSHHQAIRETGRNLRVTAHALDGIIEAVEWTDNRNWVIGVQWHPERLVASDTFAQAIFRKLVEVAGSSSAETAAVAGRHSGRQ